MDWFPVVSQAKSAFQAITGDIEGARRTQENFSRLCPGVSQVRSAIEAISGDTDAAYETQKQYIQNVSGIVDSIPVVGHVKSVIHIAAGDQEGGERAAIAATRGIGVAMAGVAGTIVAGPAGGIAAAVGTGTAIDTAFTVGSNHERPQGVYQALSDKNMENNAAGAVFDAIMVPIGDALPAPEDVVLSRIPTNI